jgi:hypothetical protein
MQCQGQGDCPGATVDCFFSPYLFSEQWEREGVKEREGGRGRRDLGAFIASFSTVIRACK